MKGRTRLADALTVGAVRDRAEDGGSAVDPFAAAYF